MRPVESSTARVVSPPPARNLQKNIDLEGLVLRAQGLFKNAGFEEVQVTIIQKDNGCHKLQIRYPFSYEPYGPAVNPDRMIRIYNFVQKVIEAYEFVGRELYEQYTRENSTRLELDTGFIESREEVDALKMRADTDRVIGFLHNLNLSGITVQAGNGIINITGAKKPEDVVTITNACSAARKANFNRSPVFHIQKPPPPTTSAVSTL